MMPSPSQIEAEKSIFAFTSVEREVGGPIGNKQGRTSGQMLRLVHRQDQTPENQALRGVPLHRLVRKIAALGIAFEQGAGSTLRRAIATSTRRQHMNPITLSKIEAITL